MLVTLKEVMEIAEADNFAIGAFNTPNLESVEAVIGAAEDLRLPVIIQFAQCHEELIPLEVIGPVMVAAAQRAAIPVCVHLDHGETLEYLKKALNIGFTSIMYDGSNLSDEENVRNTQKAVSLAESFGADVEAELGSMGKRESGKGDLEGAGENEKIYTDPIQAGKFVDATKITALACSFGTTHGIYLTEPQLNFDIVRKVRQQTLNIPVVMHGGSGVSREDFHQAITAGVRKINYFTYMDRESGMKVRERIKQQPDNEPLHYTEIIKIAVEAMRENIKNAIAVFAFRD